VAPAFGCAAGLDFGLPAGRAAGRSSPAFPADPCRILTFARNGSHAEGAEGAEDAEDAENRIGAFLRVLHFSAASA
jgi:hypothetical protein